MEGRCGCCERISNEKWVVVSSIFENSGDSHVFSYSAYPPVFLTLVRLVHLVPHLLCHLFAAHYTLPHVPYLTPSLAAAGTHPHPSAFVAFGFQLRRFQGVTIITKKWYDEQIALLASGAAD